MDVQIQYSKYHNKNSRQLKSAMSNPHLNLQQQFFDNPNHQDLPYLSSPDQPAPHIKIYDGTHSNHLSPISPTDNDPLLNSSANKFYQQYKRIFSVSYNLQTEKERLRDVFEELQERILVLQIKLHEGDPKTRQIRPLNQSKREQQSEENRNKRSRRTAEQIQKKYKCEVTYCQRFYGSQGSLQQHIKLKHPQLLRSQDEEEDQYRPHPKDSLDNSID